MREPRPALFLDRDGVINVNRGYVCRRDAFDWLPGIFDLARTAVRADLPLVVVTNQSGIGRGFYTEADFHALSDFMEKRFAAEGAPITRIYHCPFHPDAEEARYRHPDHPWRKPRPGMLLAARDDLAIDLGRSMMLGDRRSDLEAAATAGIGAIGYIGAVDFDVAGLPPFQRFETPGDAVPWLERLLARDRTAARSGA